MTTDYEGKQFLDMASVYALVLELITIWASIEHIVNSFSYSETFDYNTTTSALADKVCSGTEVLDSTTSTSDLQCTFLCVQDAICEGSFYHDADKNCVLCSKYYTDTTSLTSYTGMKYYRARTCAEWGSLGLNQSVTAQIDPLQNGPVNVYCNFDWTPGKAWTVMGHNNEDRTHINGYETCYSYIAYIIYDIGLTKAEAVVDLSTECQQYLKIECKHIGMRGCVGWENRTGGLSTYFTGSPSGKFCACGDAGMCDDGATHCNCDWNDDTWREDDGYVTIKSDLPITRFRAGDTGSSIEEAYHTIGPLMCA